MTVVVVVVVVVIVVVMVVVVEGSMGVYVLRWCVF